MAAAQETIEFRVPTKSDIEILQTNFNNCEWKEEYIKDINEEQVINYRILKINGDIIGIICFFYIQAIPIGIKNYPLYYISTRCTKDKPEDEPEDKPGIKRERNSNKPKQPPKGRKSYGRLLWAYALREISQLNQNNEFIIYNHAIPDSRDYHIKMHMKITSEINIPNFANTIKNIFYYTNPELNTAKIPVEEFDEVYLFYYSHQYPIDYNNIDSILDFISLPVPTGNSVPPEKRHRGGGKKTKRQKDKKI